LGLFSIKISFDHGSVGKTTPEKREAIYGKTGYISESQDPFPSTWDPPP